MPKYYAYILESEKTGRFYKGCSGNPKRRLVEHNAGKTISIKQQIPFKLIWAVSKPTLSEARILERKLKNITSRERIKALMEKYPSEL